MKRSLYDLVVVGAGSGGYAAARTARECGATVALVDHGPLGGLCILRGCMPSKALLASSDALQDAREAHLLGIEVAGAHADFEQIMARKRTLVAQFAQDRIAGIETFPTYVGQARFLGGNELAVGDDVVLAAKKFILATGSVVAPVAIDGLREVGYLDSDDVLELREVPASVAVLGGGYVGCELGQFLARLGSKTTMIVRAARLLSSVDADIGEALTGYFREEGIEICTATQVLRVERRAEKKVLHVVADGVHGEIIVDEIFYAQGRVPNISGLGLEAAGVTAHAITGIDVDDTLRTSNPDIYAVGDVTGEYLLVHVAIYQGELAARNALGVDVQAADYALQSAHTIFSDPQIAVVGKTERQLLAAGTGFLKGTYAFAEHGKAMCLGKTKGFVKMLALPEDGRILGAAVIGPQASELIHEVIVAMHYGAKVQDFMRIVHLHPTLAEIWTYPAEECASRLTVEMAG